MSTLHADIAGRDVPAPQGARAIVAHALEHAAHYLPAQLPLHAFVHHNTLHAFEHLDFHAALAEASALYGTEPYQSETAFAEALRRGRITEREIECSLAAQAEGAHPLWPGGPLRRELWRFRLLHAFETPSSEALAFMCAEHELFREPHAAVPMAARAEWARERATTRRLKDLWQVLEAEARPTPAPDSGLRLRDRWLEQCGEDIDDRVRPLLIRLASAYLDQGVAETPMPARGGGFLEAVRELYAAGAPEEGPWLRGISSLITRHRGQGFDAVDTIIDCLATLAIPQDRWDAYVLHTLLALRGWAGMFEQYSAHPERMPVRALPATLADYLAVQLMLEACALQHVAAHCVDRAGEVVPARGAHAHNLTTVFEAFVSAQALGLDADLLAQEGRAALLVREIEAFDGLTRRRLLHEAYERHYRDHIFDSVLAHRAHRLTAPAAARFAAVFCMDEREESTRRHLEELAPEVTTYGFAGFFGVPMAYQGIDDIRPRPLCPIVVNPGHLVEEVPLDPASAERYRHARKRLGKTEDFARTSRHALLRGGAWSLLVGTLKLIPLLGVSLFPRHFHRLTHHLSHAGAARPNSRLAIEFRGEIDELSGLRKGFTVEEMAAIVAGVLKTMGLVRDFPPLVLFVGHGSSSLNNPHEAAHDCGATGGGRGGPNARAFAAMANHAGVRAQLQTRGISIPPTTWFLGGYHNTCDDAMEYFDLDDVPVELSAALQALMQTMTRACRNEAHERCRRFESAPEDLRLEDALAHAEEHANDLAQPRPEYGHATNAVCIIGRRRVTRGLYLDRRAFLISYDPDEDPTGDALGNLLAAAGPVGAGISLEYYFSFIDPRGYGCGTKLPHNITGLIGVMDGHASDLRTGLPWQMVEIHEPMRLLVIVEATPEQLVRIVETREVVATLVLKSWIQLASLDPATGEISVFEDGRFVPYDARATALAARSSSIEHYAGHREHLPCAHIGKEVAHAA